MPIKKIRQRLNPPGPDRNVRSVKWLPPRHGETVDGCPSCGRRIAIYTISEAMRAVKTNPAGFTAVRCANNVWHIQPRTVTKNKKKRTRG